MSFWVLAALILGLHAHADAPGVGLHAADVYNKGDDQENFLEELQDASRCNQFIGSLSHQILQFDCS